MYWSYPYGMISQSGMVSQRRERIFSEEFLQNNIGKKVSAHMNYDGSVQWRDRIFTGTLKEVGRDFFVIGEQKTGKDVLLLNINLSFMVFEEPANV